MINNKKIDVKLLKSAAKFPDYAYEGDAGFDLCSCENIKIDPLSRQVVHCGISLKIPEGCAGLVIPRSGLAAKNGISVVNSPGLIDSGYRGEIMVILLNTDKDHEFEISIGDRIAQMMIVPFVHCNFNEVENLDSTERDSKGFGSSGI